jgi:hypothetical protein
MNLRAMVAVTAAITVERLAPGGVHLAQAIGVVVIGVGLVMMSQTKGSGNAFSRVAEYELAFNLELTPTSSNF